MKKHANHRGKYFSILKEMNWHSWSSMALPNPTELFHRSQTNDQTDVSRLMTWKQMERAWLIYLAWLKTYRKRKWLQSWQKHKTDSPELTRDVEGEKRRKCLQETTWNYQKQKKCHLLEVTSRAWQTSKTILCSIKTRSSMNWRKGE